MQGRQAGTPRDRHPTAVEHRERGTCETGALVGRPPARYIASSRSGSLRAARRNPSSRFRSSANTSARLRRRPVERRTSSPTGTLSSSGRALASRGRSRPEILIRDLLDRRPTLTPHPLERLGPDEDRGDKRRAPRHEQLGGRDGDRGRDLRDAGHKRKGGAVLPGPPRRDANAGGLCCNRLSEPLPVPQRAQPRSKLLRRLHLIRRHRHREELSRNVGRQFHGRSARAGAVFSHSWLRRRRWMRSTELLSRAYVPRAIPSA